MSLFRLVKDNSGMKDFECPHCKKGISVDNWDTEYGDPVVGEHETKCPYCEKKLTIGVYIEYTVS